MVVTSDLKPLDPSEPISPLIKPTTKAPPLRQRSTGSFSHISDFQLDGPLNRDGSGDDEPSSSKQAAEVRHTALSLDAREWRQAIFKAKVLSLLRKLRVPKWTASYLTPSCIHLQRVSGATTNAVFFVSFNPSNTPTAPEMSPLLTPKMPPHDPAHPVPVSEDQYPPTLLLRVYGPSSDALISRTEELRILNVLSSVYHLGPKIYGTFINGRVEQFFPSSALTPKEMRQKNVSRCIAKRMRELHGVDLKLLGLEDKEPMVWRFLREWADLAEEVLVKLKEVNEEWRKYVEQFALLQVRGEMEKYRAWVSKQGTQKVVFSHGDAQYGNILKLDNELPRGVPEHLRYIVIDFEYASPNARGFDIANHFHEWRADYHHPTHSHSLRPHLPYPTSEERETFYHAYLGDGSEEGAKRLEEEVRVWSPASSAFWALWGIVQASDHVDAMVEGLTRPDDFDYLSYAIERAEMFRDETRKLGLVD